jgi:hypothetical protein
MTKTSIPPATGRDGRSAAGSFIRELIGRITPLEMIVGAVIGLVMLGLVVIEPEILEAPFENERTLIFTFGGTALAAIALVAMLWFRVPPFVRLIVLVVPFAIVNWWLISPYFIDETVDEAFSTSISQQLDPPDVTTTVPTTRAGEDEPPTDSEDPVEAPPTTVEEPPVEPTGPALLGAGEFVGLAGHSGTGDAGLFQNADGSLVLRFENFDIQNGPDLEVYLVPGSDQTSLAEGSIHLGALKGNVGDQNYQLPPGTELAPGAYTALVWCEAFSVEFVGATVVI